MVKLAVVPADVLQTLELLTHEVLFHPLLSGALRSYMSSFVRNMFAAVLSLSYITEVVLHSWCVYWHLNLTQQASWLSRKSTVLSMQPGYTLV
jgi:hypothetical protein